MVCLRAHLRPGQMPVDRKPAHAIDDNLRCTAQPEIAIRLVSWSTLIRKVSLRQPAGWRYRIFPVGLVLGLIAMFVRRLWSRLP